MPPQVKKIKLAIGQKDIYFQKLIDQKVAELFKENYSSEQINKKFNEIMQNALFGSFFIPFKNFAKILVLAGANINAVNEYGFTLLMAALLKEKDDIAKFLVENGADINRESKGHTALTLAIRIPTMTVGQITQIMGLLLDNGADLKMKIDGETPLELAHRLGRKYAEKIIEDKMREKGLIK